ncbi:MAG: hypothetical protein HGA45_06300 [Chloroflexales bacterium]|nr:hypothetical protein [Chloroflexales bacterium]
MLQQAIVTPTNHKAKPKGQEAKEQAQAPVEAVKTEAGISGSGAEASGAQIEPNCLAGGQQLLNVVAVAGVGGVVGNLAIVLTLLPAMALGRAGRVTHLAQLAQPATIGLVLAVTVLVALARFRLGLELAGLLPPPLLP